MNRLRPLSFGIKTAQRYATHDALLDVWQEAESIPIFEHAWLNDHFMGLDSTPTGPYLESWTLLAALAAQTRRMRVGVMVTDTTYRHPAVLAKMAATVDVISHGRLNFGIGTGWSERQHLVYGIPLPAPGERIRRLAEACELIRRLWTEDTVDHTGPRFSYHGLRVLPKPLQSPPDIWLGGSAPSGLRRVGRFGARAPAEHRPGKRGRAAFAAGKPAASGHPQW